MNRHRVTIVIATYNRPEALKIAVYSVLKQSIEDWILYVIGDNCDERTEKAISEFKDKRIIYINLPDRFGEQSGPNSVGIALAKSKYIAFLNHDDVWLKDHLELGLSILEHTDYNFYLAGCAASRFLEFNENRFKIHVDELVADKRSSVDFFKRKEKSFEPASSWIIDTSLTNKLGDWKSYDEIFRCPIEDYILRAWRSGAKFYFSKYISIWRVITQYHNNSKTGYYNYVSNEHNTIKDILNSKSSSEIRTLLIEKNNEWNLMNIKKKKAIKSQYSFAFNQPNKATVLRAAISRMLLYNSISAYIFKISGFDIFSTVSSLRGRKKGYILNRLISRRTGTPPKKLNKKEVIEQIVAEQKD